jgi:xylulokinase
MPLLGLDVGSSSVKAAILRDRDIAPPIVRAEYPTRFDGVRAEVDADALLAAVAEAIRQIGAAARAVDAIALSVMSPAWVAMDADGNAITPIITHQDRRSIEIARRIESTVGKDRHLAIAGNRPIPGGISSTTAAWFIENAADVMRRADLVGHVNTLLLRQLTGARAIDPSNASFTGLYRTVDQGGWDAELCAVAGVSQALLPQILEADKVASRVTTTAAAAFGLTQGTPVLTGMVDTSAAMISTGAAIGQLFNMCGSTDVLGLCTDRPVPHERLLTRAIGIGRKWMSVSTIAAAGSALTWVREQFYRELPVDAFFGVAGELSRQRKANTVVFEPYLAGDRMSIEQKRGAFFGLTLATTRDDLLNAVVESLAQASAARIPLLAAGGTPMLRDVVTSGGGAAIADILHRDWPGEWRFHETNEAGLRGLATIQPREVGS